MILANKEAAEKFNFNKAIFPGTQGGPLEHVIAGKAVCFGEALKPEFKAYQHQVAANAKALAQALKNEGFKLLTDGTDNHLLLLDFSGTEMTGKLLETLLEEANITVNKNTIPNDPEKPFVTSGIRIGTPAATTRGFGIAEVTELAGWICDILDAIDDPAVIDAVRAKVSALCARFPVYGR